ncbi:hypothetical protein R3P38DRAFT_3448567 [Favolaschia claudopus]|uniref:Kelch repeat-containing protein n=1 Tax=Favolaschia claudopus TaxID=2862362 RepID=A0AAW0CRK5_9AGAR
MALPWPHAPRKPLALSSKAAESPSSHASRQSRAKTAKTKTEKEETALSSNANLTVRKLLGDAPPCEVPCSFAIDHEQQTVFFNTYDENTKASEIYACNPQTRTWKNITKTIRHLPHPLGSPERAEQLPPRYGGSMAFYKIKSTGQRVLLLFGGQVNGLKTDDDGPDGPGEVSNEMLAIDVDNLKWWVIDIAGGRVSPRVQARMLVVDDSLFVFGGQTYDGDVRLAANESYCIASYNNYAWTWDVRDEPYPAHTPALGYCCDAVALSIQDEDDSSESPDSDTDTNNKILLTIGCTDNGEESLNLTPTSFVLFDIVSRTFTLLGQQTIAANTNTSETGTFPGGVTWYGIFALPPQSSGNVKTKTKIKNENELGEKNHSSTSNAAIICTFHANATKQPELYIYTPGQCRTLGVRKRIAATKKTFEMFFVVGDKMYMLGWTADRWDLVAEVPRQWVSL